MQRGRRSAIQRATVVHLNHHRPPTPPAELSAGEKVIWRDILKNLPPDWVPQGAYPLMVQYVRHLGALQWLESAACKFEVEDLADEKKLAQLDKLRRMIEGEVRVATMLARSLRLTVPTMVHAITASRKLANFRKPSTTLWDTKSSR